MNTKTGLDVLKENNFSQLKGYRAGLLINPASVDRNFKHIADLIYEEKDITMSAIFGPQHGLYGNTQDNMIEWEGFIHPYYKCPVYSLYGEVREPKESMLSDIDIIVIDLPDVGARYYTFLWTALLMLKAVAKKDIKVILLDRPNPIRGDKIEGPSLNENFLSFVGLHPLIIRHGLTIGEALTIIHRELKLTAELDVIAVKNWSRHMWHDETGLPWVMPSPNMPTLDTATVYPGGCLIEGTLLSEGRGTTRPFEIIGAPYIDPFILAKDMKEFNLNGVYFRPLYFEPAFQKHGGKICGGIQLHVTDRNKIEPVKTFVAILLAVRKRYEKENLWRNPPYEYEYEKLPFDILSGSEKLRKDIDRGENLEAIVSLWKEDKEKFKERRKKYLLYE
jgi:uncharacterized protein YbbC (DUF1343 family)